jgi:dynein heavy chain
LLKILS